MPVTAWHSHGTRPNRNIDIWRNSLKVLTFSGKPSGHGRNLGRKSRQEKQLHNAVGFRHCLLFEAFLVENKARICQNGTDGDTIVGELSPIAPEGYAIIQAVDWIFRLRSMSGWLCQEATVEDASLHIVRVLVWRQNERGLSPSSCLLLAQCCQFKGWILLGCSFFPSLRRALRDAVVIRQRSKMLKLFGVLKPNGKEKDEDSNYGDDSFTEAKVKQSSLLDDIKAFGPNLGKGALTLLEEVASTGKPYDDRTFLVGWIPRSL